jgi:hypothetical protein
MSNIVPLTISIGRDLIVMSTVGRIHANPEIPSIRIYNHHEDALAHYTFDNKEDFDRVVGELRSAFEVSIHRRIKV